MVKSSEYVKGCREEERNKPVHGDRTLHCSKGDWVRHVAIILGIRMVKCWNGCLHRLWNYQ